MRIFAIADASKRKARPIGVLFWEPSDDDEQGRFSLELSSSCAEDTLPLSLSFCAQRKGRRATPEESRRWVESRIVPEGRHNIAEVIMANGLSGYDEVGLLAASKGRSSDDDFLAYEVNLAEPLESTLRLDNLDAAGRNAHEATRADRILGALVQEGSAPKFSYALIDLGGQPEAPAKTKRRHVENRQSGNATAAQRIGASVRAQRLEAGLTQKQLAARAGITQTVLSRVESGAGNPTLALLEALAAALGAELNVSLAFALVVVRDERAS